MKNLNEEEITNNNKTQNNNNKAQSQNSLYASYFFAAWGDRMWEFAAVIFLMAIFPTSLFPSSFFGFCENIAGIAFGGSIGRFVDSTDRLKVVRTSIVGQNLVIFVASLVFVWALSSLSSENNNNNNNNSHNNIINTNTNQNSNNNQNDDSNFVFTLFSFPDDMTSQQKSEKQQRLLALLIIVIAGMIAKVTSSLNKISIHKDWCVVLAAGNSEFQTKLNSNMRRVDLTCSILAPLVVGILSTWFSPTISCAFIACWSFVSLFIEWYLSGVVYSEIPELQSPKKKSRLLPVTSSSSSSSSKQNSQEKQNKEEEEEQQEDTYFTILQCYLKHPVFPISLSYCLLYISLLSFGGIMVAYLRTLGCSDALLAMGRGLAALVAIGATFAFPSMVSSLGLVSAGKLSAWLQVAALSPLAFLFLKHFVSSTSQSSENNESSTMTIFIVIVFISVCCSRFGLWAFDLCETQLMQESVDLRFAGRVNGAQEILVNFCYLISFCLTMIEDDPKRFAGPALVSFGSILLAAIVFSVFSDESEKVSKIMKKKMEKEEEKQLQQEQEEEEIY